MVVFFVRRSLCAVGCVQHRPWANRWHLKVHRIWSEGRETILIRAVLTAVCKSQVATTPQQLAIAILSVHAHESPRGRHAQNPRLLEDSQTILSELNFRLLRRERLVTFAERFELELFLRYLWACRALIMLCGIEHGCVCCPKRVPVPLVVGIVFPLKLSLRVLLFQIRNCNRAPSRIGSRRRDSSGRQWRVVRWFIDLFEHFPVTDLRLLVALLVLAEEAHPRIGLLLGPLSRSVSFGLCLFKRGVDGLNIGN